MKIITYFTILLFCSITALSQDNKNPKINFIAGIASINHLRINNAIQTGFSLITPTSKKINYMVAYQYLLGANIKQDDLSIFGKTFNYNSHVQQSQINGLMGFEVLNAPKVTVNIYTGVSLNFLKQSFVDNIYLKEIIPNQPLQLVSESTFEKKFQLGSTSSISTVFNLGRFNPGINLQYQVQKEFQFFSPSLTLNYKL